MIIWFDLNGLIQGFAAPGIVDWTPLTGFEPAPPPTGVTMEYIYFCRHKARR